MKLFSGAFWHILHTKLFSGAFRHILHTKGDARMAIFSIGKEQFLLDGSPFRILSGAIHYFRIHPEQWMDRLNKLKACGFNTVETYVAWNYHQPRESECRFDGNADLARFLRMAQEAGLWAIVRPSPYICAEWEFGGLPAWLLQEPRMRLRCASQPYLDKVDAWFDRLIPKLVPLQCTRGGPVLAMQVENEYGSYGGDKAYLRHLTEGMRARGVEVPLFTSDGPEDLMLSGGTLPDVFKTVNFGSRPVEAFQTLRTWQPEGPPMVMEYWNGWFDHWGEPHHTRTAEDAATVFETMMETGASVNFYMFHGGTNFGFWNGANRQDRYEPTITSYDYDSPLSEHGDATEKWFKVREVLARHVPVDMAYVPPVSLRRAYGEVRLVESAPLLSCLDTLSMPVQSVWPEPMEAFGQAYGFILYETTLPPVSGTHTLQVRGVHDRAQLFVDGAPVGVLERDTGTETVEVALQGTNHRLAILVENMGRINYGERLLDRKGIQEGVRFDYQYLFHWTVRTLTLEDLSGVPFAAEEPGNPSCSTSGPVLRRGWLEVDTPGDTFLSVAGWNKGVIWVNGFNLGRYWKRGPQKTLYVPAPLLKQGLNEVVVLELHPGDACAVSFLDLPDLG
jgi:beta-galactosidase